MFLIMYLIIPELKIQTDIIQIMELYGRPIHLQQITIRPQNYLVSPKVILYVIFITVINNY